MALDSSLDAFDFFPKLEPGLSPLSPHAHHGHHHHHVHSSSSASLTGGDTLDESTLSAAAVGLLPASASGVSEVSAATSAADSVLTASQQHGGALAGAGGACGSTGGSSVASSARGGGGKRGAARARGPETGEGQEEKRQKKLELNRLASRVRLEGLGFEWMGVGVGLIRCCWVSRASIDPIYCPPIMT